MQKIVHPKCPYCHMEFKPASPFSNPLQGLYGEYCSDTIRITCSKCGKDYYVSKQIRFLARKNK